MPRDHQLLASTGARDEEKASFPLQIERVSMGVILDRGEGGSDRHMVVVHTGDNHAAEFQPLHAVHGSERNFVLGFAFPGQQMSANRLGFKAFRDLLGSPFGARGDADLLRCNAVLDPGLDCIHYVVELGGLGGEAGRLRRRAVDFGSTSGCMSL
nr:hypothetical protein [Nocardia yunnanensis]